MRASVSSSCRSFGPEEEEEEGEEEEEKEEGEEEEKEDGEQEQEVEQAKGERKRTSRPWAHDGLFKYRDTSDSNALLLEISRSSVYIKPL